MRERGNIEELSVEQILSRDYYVIPLYQRNYAWAEPEITQLIEDVWDYAQDREKSKQPYFIGTLVVYERMQEGEHVYETIDGQQRLTTLLLIVAALHRICGSSEELKGRAFTPRLGFDGREKSIRTIDKIINLDRKFIGVGEHGCNPDIEQGYRDAEKALKRILDADEAAQGKFIPFLMDNVRILRVKVPTDTDLNHYFEIMNNRGEQLEKHEIVKSQMLAVLKDQSDLRYAFHRIWEACSDMERYVQYGFSVDERSRIFAGNDWDGLQISSFEEVAQILADEQQKKAPKESDGGREDNLVEDELSLSEILASEKDFAFNESHDDEAPERFNSVVTFPNFLLHVLRLQMWKEKDVPLDDKRLIDSFAEFYAGREAMDFVKSFAIHLLRCKFLFDKYVIKREYLRGRDRWSLKTLKRREEKKAQVSYTATFQEEHNEWIIKILSMFHVSAPTMIYKHWLNAALHYLNQKHCGGRPIESQDYLEYLYGLAEAYLFDRFLVPAAEQKDYFEIIYMNGGRQQNSAKSGALDLSLLDRGTAVENFIFNYLDFKLWAEDKDSKFEFGFRSSVEHYYPQYPVAENEKLSQEICDNFGNLCLLSSSKNAKLSNHLPRAKMDYYEKAGFDSMKQKRMMEQTKSSGDWSAEQILEAGLQMRDILISPITLPVRVST